MLYNVPRMFADWLADATHGANALLPTVPRDIDTPQPAAFALITVETKDGDTARGELPKMRPCLTVAADVVIDQDGQVQEVTADGKVKVRFRIGIDNAISADAVADLEIRLRAVTWSVRRFTDPRINAEHNANRTRNAIYLESCLSLASQVVWAKDQQGTATVSGYVVGDFQARDLTPTG